ncbi:hypothetical protein GCM10010156_37480 [Planobispora rosea]|uniref:Signal peptidase I n=1 Tax=Planobispora rosea TaxID=35762 RepID=A0A8J3S198_PLARO|nr:signal peptidase I [Planobispora rosea]GGS75170.1 hypothetical protein GCM10010156_37480 [Planobispora rosea]GIH81823.1 hypothetical protein Pro02_02310 [Planobispora rosea]
MLASRFRLLIAASLVTALSGCSVVIDRATSAVLGEKGYVMTGESMEPTLIKGGQFTASMIRGEYIPRIGDVVVFDAPDWEEKHSFVSRVIGGPGTRVECCHSDGRLLVNGVPLEEPYLYPGDAPSDYPFAVTVPAGRLWLMSDHRAVALDSRAHQGDPGGGTIAVTDVLSVVETDDSE